MKRLYRRCMLLLNMNDYVRRTPKVRTESKLNPYFSKKKKTNKCY